jgi:hypothetical protein
MWMGFQGEEGSEGWLSVEIILERGRGSGDCRQGEVNMTGRGREPVHASWCAAALLLPEGIEWKEAYEDRGWSR